MEQLKSTLKKAVSAYWLTWQPSGMWSVFWPYMQQRLWRQKKDLKGWKVKPQII